MRETGGLAGLAPAALVAVFLVGTGSIAAADIATTLAGITVAAMAVGWIVGPLARGSLRTDLKALVAYALVAALSYLLVGSARAWIESATGGAPNRIDGARLMAGHLLYGLLYLPFWTAFLTPVAAVWVIAVRVLRRRAGLTPSGFPLSVGPGRSDGLETIRPRRIALIAAAIIVVYGLFVALLPLALYNDPRPPWWIYRPIALFSLFAVPAMVGGIGAFRGVRPLLVAAGVMCLLQAYIAFSGITIGFVVPGIVLLLVAAAEKWPQDAPPTRSALFAGVGVIVLTVGAWISLLALTEEVCWVTSPRPDGTLIYERVPVADVMTLAPGQTGGGCDGGTLTVQGIVVTAVLAIGAIIVAAAAASVRPPPDPDG